MLDTKDVTDISYKTAFLETLAHVLKGNIGAGLFAMGDAFRNAGFLVGLIGTIFIGSICIYNNHLLVKLSREVKIRKNLAVSPSFQETITFSFELGPPAFRKLAKPVMIIMKTFICITQLGFCVIYISLVGETVSTMLKGTYDISVRWCIVATFPILLAASLIHTLKFLAPVSAISTFCILYGYAVSIIMSAIDLPDISTRKMVAPVEQWPLFIGTVIFAFEGIALVIPLKNEMKEPEKFDKPLGPLNIGMSAVMCLLISLGFMSYFKYGDDIRDSVTFNLPQTWPGESAKALFALGILLSYPLQFYVPTNIFFQDITKKWGPFRYPLLVEMLLRTVLLAVTYIVAITVPYVSLLLSLIGAVCSNALALLFPAMSDICLRACPCPPVIENKEEGQKEDQESELKKNPSRFFMDIVSLILSIIGTIFGTYIALRAIVNKFIADVQGRDRKSVV